jgi:large subunit ribosomal protein L22
MAGRSSAEIPASQLQQHIKLLNDESRKKLIKTSARKAEIKSDFVGHWFDVFNGKKYVRVQVTDAMVGKKLGQVVDSGVTAQLRHVSIPTRKMRRVLALLEDKPTLEDAVNRMNFTPKIAALHVAQTLKAAAANFLARPGAPAVRPEELKITTLFSDPGPAAKRIRYQSMGRVFRYKKRYSHLVIGVEPTADALKAVAERSRVAKATGRKAKSSAPVTETEAAAAEPKKKTTRKKSESK